MPRQSAADKRAEEARVAITYKLNSVADDETVALDDLRTIAPDGIGDEVLDEVLAELVAAGTVVEDDGEYTLAEPDDDDLDADERVAIPELVARDGYGFVVVEAPLDLVYAYSKLHPAEQASLSAASAGALRKMLTEMGKLRHTRTLPDDVPSFAVVAPEVA